jgi:Nif-specific regulatory protein
MPDKGLQHAVGAESVARAAAELARLAKGDNEGQFLSQAVAVVLRAVGGDQLALASATSGRWNTLAAAGSSAPLPVDLLAEALDSEMSVSASDWVAVPLPASRERGEILAVHGVDRRETAEILAAVLAVSLETVRSRGASLRRSAQLETILQITHEWNRTNEMEPLLVQMAEAATQLFGADRASIFLWDRPNKTLVGRPALGVPGGELRIADDTGIVGKVVHSGEAMRVDSDDRDAQIDREVDDQLQYQTRNLVCVPILSNDNRMLGALEVLNKTEGDFTKEDEQGLAELASHAAVALENIQQLEELLSSHRQIVDQAAEGVQMIGDSPAVEALRSTVARVADTELAVLILGENGTGKEVIAQQVHYRSRRRSAPFIAVNCASLAETLLESELFGHEKGAFTDAHEMRAGKFELATGGTLFLDEIGDLSLGGQAKLLRVLEEKVVVRVGGSTSIHTDARVVAATNQNLAEMVRDKKFREDLYFRLNVVTLELPPLRERGDDVLLLAEHFLSQFCRNARRKMPKFSAAARKRLLGHAWPGNVRELRNLMERLAYLLPEDRPTNKIEAEDLAFILSPRAEQRGSVAIDMSLAEATRVYQIEHIERTIAAAGGNMSEAAERLGLHRSNLYRKMRQLGADVEE